MESVEEGNFDLFFEKLQALKSYYFQKNSNHMIDSIKKSLKLLSMNMRRQKMNKKCKSWRKADWNQPYTSIVQNFRNLVDFSSGVNENQVVHILVSI